LLYILFGQDDFSIHELLEEIKRGLGDQTLLSANTTVLDGKQLSLAELRVAGETVPFLAEKRLVIIKGLLERFEAKGKSAGQKKTRPAAGEESECQSLATHLLQLPESTVLVLVDGKVVKDNPLLRRLSGRAQVKQFPLLSDNELRAWIRRRVSGEGGNILPQAVSLLAKLVGNNLWTMANEIKKLVLLASGRRIEEADVRAVVSYAQEASVFAMVDAILESKPGVAQRWLQQLLAEGAAPVYLLFMLSRQAQLIIRAKVLGSQGEPKAEIQSRLGLPSEFALRRTLEQADKYSWLRLKAVYHKLLATDLAIKTGRYEAELALNILIAELGQ